MGESINHGNAIPSTSPRLLSSSSIDYPLQGGETLLVGVVISNCTGTTFESPQSSNTYGQRLEWDPNAFIGPTVINSDRSFDSQDLETGQSSTPLSFKVFMTDET